jgi:unsaturated rhamnogalacturonyl hydrolase
VDTLGLVCPFLVLYDNNYQTNKYAALAVSQIEKFVEFGMFKDSFLPVHSYEVNTGFPVGVFGWGRGTGWFILGVLDSYLELKDGQLKERLEKILRETAAYYLQFQREDGGFGIFIQDKNTYDSSATAVFAYFYAKCFQIFGNAEYFRSLEKSLEKLQSFTRRDGALDYCQGDTVEVGVFSQRLDIMPFAQGMLLRAVKIYENNRSEK